MYIIENIDIKKRNSFCEEKGKFSAYIFPIELACETYDTVKQSRLFPRFAAGDVDGQQDPNEILDNLLSVGLEEITVSTYFELGTGAIKIGGSVGAPIGSNIMLGRNPISGGDEKFSEIWTKLEEHAEELEEAAKVKKSNGKIFLHYSKDGALRDNLKALNALEIFRDFERIVSVQIMLDKAPTVEQIEKISEYAKVIVCQGPLLKNTIGNFLIQNGTLDGNQGILLSNDNQTLWIYEEII